MNDTDPHNGWALVNWEGNPDLGYQCWRKQFGRGHVSVGVGDFDLVVFSYGTNSDRSYSSTRRLVSEGRMLSEQEAMEAVDRGNGKTLQIKPARQWRP